MTQAPERFPKVKSPYVRNHNDDGDYLVTSTVQDGYEWVFDKAKDVDAVEKIHGENTAIKITNGEVTSVSVRRGDRIMDEINPYSSDPSTHYTVRGVQNSIRRGYIDDLEDDWHFGELVGPKIHNNMYDLDEHLFIPFEWLRDKCTYNSYGEYSTEFKDISQWFENGLFSLFYMRMHSASIKEASVDNGTYVEGIIFVHPDMNSSYTPESIETTDSENYKSVATNICKLRRDMFDWFR